MSKNKVGRPSLYTEELQAKADEYINQFLKKRETEENPSGLFEAFPSNEGLQIYLGLADSTMYDWKNDPSKPKFSGTLELIKRVQKLYLVNYSTIGAFNAQIAKLMLSANHGVSEKIETVNTNTNYNFEHMSDEELKKLLGED